MSSNKILQDKYRHQAYPIAAEYMSEIEEAFNLFDGDKDGRLDFYEFKVAMRALGFDVKKNEILKILERLDPENKTSISNADFVALMVEKISQRDPREEYRKAFRLFDSENKGYISSDDLEMVARELGENLSKSEIESMIKEFDLDEDGKINEEEFINIMTGNFSAF